MKLNLFDEFLLLYRPEIDRIFLNFLHKGSEKYEQLTQNKGKVTMKILLGEPDSFSANNLPKKLFQMTRKEKFLND